jgi:hypothetical protein
VVSEVAVNLHISNTILDLSGKAGCSTGQL